VLTQKFQEGKLLVIQDFALEEIKTQKVAEILEKFGVKKAMLVAEDNRNLELSTRNLPGAMAVSQAGVNVFDLLKYDYLMLSDASLKKIEGALQK
jgi:large subunit ribosomal protein L4